MVGKSRRATKRRKPSGSKSFATLIAKYGLDVRSIDVQSGLALSSLPKELLSFFIAAKSSYEQTWRAIGDAMIAEFFGSPVTWRGYEWMSFKLPAAKYTPDFSYRLADGRMIHVEVKPSKFSDNYRDSRSRLRAAATLNPFFIFAEARVEKGRWILEIIEPDSEFLESLASFALIVAQKDIENAAI